MKINNTESFFQILLSGVSKGSMPDPTLSNIFINDLFLFIKVVELANYTDDNTIYTEKNMT